MAIASSLDVDTGAELQSLVDFARTMVVKAQELADAAEPLALASAGVSYPGVDTQGAPSRWVHQAVYVDPWASGPPAYIARQAYWVAVGLPNGVAGPNTATGPGGTRWSGSPSGWSDGNGNFSSSGPGWAFDGALAASYGGPAAFVDPDTKAVWLHANNDSWTNLATGVTVSTFQVGWSMDNVVALPNNLPSLIDPQAQGVRIAILTWVDATTGEVSAVGPEGAATQFPSGAPDPTGALAVLQAPAARIAFQSVAASGQCYRVTFGATTVVAKVQVPPRARLAYATAGGGEEYRATMRGVTASGVTLSGLAASLAALPWISSAQAFSGLVRISGTVSLSEIAGGVYRVSDGALQNGLTAEMEPGEYSSSTAALDALVALISGSGIASVIRTGLVIDVFYSSPLSLASFTAADVATSGDPLVPTSPAGLTPALIFATPADPRLALQTGLSLLIRTPQDYVNARFQSATWGAGGLPDDLAAVADQVANFVSVREATYVLTQLGYLPDPLPGALADIRAGALALLGNAAAGRLADLNAAIQSFEEPGPWEDVRQPLYQIGPSGNVIVVPVVDPDTHEVTGYVPATNPLRFPTVAFRGEKNDYYRSLVLDRGINPFASRTAGQFDVLAPGTNSTITSDGGRRYMAAYTAASRVFVAGFYEKSYLGDELYLSWCRMFIAWMAILRCMDDRMRGFADIDHMDQYDLTNLLYSYGLTDYDDMPIVYKRRFLKTIETILADKGTTAAFRDIIGMFNLNSELTIWKYYLVKHFPYSAVRVTYPRAAALGEAYFLVAGGVTLQDHVSDTIPAIYHSFETSAEAVADLRAQLLGIAGIYLVVVSGVQIDIYLTHPGPLSKSDFSGYLWSDILGEVVGLATVTDGPTDFSQPAVGFLRSPVDARLIETLNGLGDPNFLEDYDAFVNGDPTWQLDAAAAAKLDFSVLETKYFSITAALDAVNNGFAIAILWGMLQDAEVKGRGATLTVPNADGLGDGVLSATLLETMVALLVLTFFKFGIDDLIPYSENGISQIICARFDGSAFPGEGSLLPYTTVLARVDDFPPPAPLSIGEVVTSTLTDIAISDEILADTAVLGRATPATVAAIEAGDIAHSVPPVPGYASQFDRTEALAQVLSLKRMWNFKFITKLTTNAWAGAERYSDWLALNNPELARWVADADASTEPGSIDNAIVSLTTLVEDAIQSGTFNFALAFGTIDIILVFVQRMINFFKSYTTELQSFSTSMLIDSPSSEGIQLVNHIPPGQFNPILTVLDNGSEPWLWDRESAPELGSVLRITFSRAPTAGGAYIVAFDTGILSTVFGASVVPDSIGAPAFATAAAALAGLAAAIQAEFGYPSVAIADVTEGAIRIVLPPDSPALYPADVDGISGTFESDGEWAPAKVDLVFNGSRRVVTDTLALRDAPIITVQTLGIPNFFFRLNNGDWNNDPTANPDTGAGGIPVAALTGALLFPAGQAESDSSQTFNFGGSGFSFSPPATFTPGWPALAGGWTSFDPSRNQGSAVLSGGNLTLSTSVNTGRAQGADGYLRGAFYFEILNNGLDFFTIQEGGGVGRDFAEGGDANAWLGGGFNISDSNGGALLAGRSLAFGVPDSSIHAADSIIIGSFGTYGGGDVVCVAVTWLNP